MRGMRTASSSGLRQGWNDLLESCYRSLEELRGDYHQALVDPTEATLFALAQAAEQRNRQTAEHCERMKFVSVAMGIVYGLDRTSLLTLYRGAHLHDIGKVGIPDSILLKPGRLDAREWEVMKTHPARGVEICRHLKTLEPVLPIIRHHQRALGRIRLSGRLGWREHSAAGANRANGGYLRRVAQRASLQTGPYRR